MPLLLKVLQRSECPIALARDVSFFLSKKDVWYDEPLAGGARRIVGLQEGPDGGEEGEGQIRRKEDLSAAD
jgi:hypothetical protein